MAQYERLDALISLLDDPDEFIIGEVKNQLMQWGESIIPELEMKWIHIEDESVQECLAEIIHTIQFDKVKTELKALCMQPDPDLLKGLILIAKYRYPYIDENHIVNQIEGIKTDVWKELHFGMSPVELVRILNYVFFRTYKFRGTKEAFTLPANNYINRVIESRSGNPVLLSCIYMIVAQKLNIPMYGVNLPHHFVLCFLDTSTFQRWEDYKKAEILCYINPYIGGKLFNYTQIDKLLNELSLPQLSMYYRPCDNRSILVRICNNLIDHFKDGGFEQEMNEVIELRTIIQNQSE